MSHGEWVGSHRHEAADIARRVIDGEATALEGAKLIASLAGLDYPAGHPGRAHVETMRLIEGETETLPIGAQRDSWSQPALDAHAAELAEAEQWAREMAWSAFEWFAVGTEAN
jgi:hypothetical protein